MENCKFENIESEYGAAIYYNGIDLKIENCRFNNLHSTITGGAIVVRGIIINDESEYYDQVGKISDIVDSVNKIHIQDVEFIPIKRDANKLSYNQTGELIKKAIIKNGAVVLSYDAETEYLNEKTNSVYHNNTYEANHDVAVIGRDDNFPKENFKITPPCNGAWIIKNSWQITGEKKDMHTYYITIY